MKSTSKAELLMHSFMCMTGGFLGAYTILNRGGNLGSAQTLNMIDIVLCLLGTNFTEFLIRIIGLLFYILGVFLYAVLIHKTKINMQRYAIIVDMAGFIILCIIPAEANPVIAIYPVFFMLSTQWSVFHGTDGYNSSSVFSTNNLRQATLALGEYVAVKDKALLKKAAYFINSVVWFHVGVAGAFFACNAFGIYAVLFCFIPSAFCMLLTFRNSRIFTAVRFAARKNRKPETV